MRLTTLILSLTLAVGIAVGAIGHHLLNAQPQPVKRTPLLKTDVAMEGREANILLVEMAPGATSGKHYHPADTFVYVLGGSITFEGDGMSPHTAKAGEVFHEAPKMVHDAKNPSTTEPVKILVFQLTEKGQPVTVPAQ